MANVIKIGGEGFSYDHSIHKNSYAVVLPILFRFLSSLYLALSILDSRD